jgi:hypothetical protein
MPDVCPACEGPWTPEGRCPYGCAIDVGEDPCRPVWAPVRRSTRTLHCRTHRVTVQTGPCPVCADLGSGHRSP